MPKPKNGASPVLNLGGCVYYTYACKQCEAETGEDNLRKTADALPGHLCRPEGGSPHHDSEIYYILAAVPPRAGVSAAGAEAVPLADDVQLDPVGLGYLAVAVV